MLRAIPWSIPIGFVVGMSGIQFIRDGILVSEPDLYPPALERDGDPDRLLVDREPPASPQAYSRESLEP